MLRCFGLVKRFTTRIYDMKVNVFKNQGRLRLSFHYQQAYSLSRWTLMNEALRRKSEHCTAAKNAECNDVTAE